ncbi:MAG: hypothetical protein J0H12_05510 [Candidatus Paracaedimonas acanthamoebae]|uniref:Cell division protein FtsL n=1 Tax=Candidatus Paracaedimonas acanthamoebae TaxID=244581 RepID=A0A8J7PJK1_9PROT|nr:hypothetical protein [Candidatus Paracaedimonas acanthamoebae]
MRRSTLIFALIALILGIVNYTVKQRVISIEQSLILAQGDIRRTEESLQLLGAEWSYLNEPSRLQMLVETHLGSMPLKGTQLVSYEQLPSRAFEESEPLRLANFSEPQ